MQPLEPPDTHYFSAAIGWLGLGNVAEAKAELAQLSQAAQKHPEVLEVRWGICAEEKDWQNAVEVARALVEVAPDHSVGWVNRAYALRRVQDGGLQAAWDALLPAADRFPRQAIIPFNLACYACQMQQLETARIWLGRAAEISGKDRIRKMAMLEPDLEPLWEEIKRWEEGKG